MDNNSVKYYTPEFIRGLRKQLPHGGIKEVAYRTSYSPEYVSFFFSGTRAVTLNNIAIIEEAKKIVNEINGTR